MGVGRRRDSGKRRGSHVGRFGPTMMTGTVAAVAVVETSNYREVSDSAGIRMNPASARYIGEWTSRWKITRDPEWDGSISLIHSFILFLSPSLHSAQWDSIVNRLPKLCRRMLTFDPYTMGLHEW